jgi:hypothetical protein
VATLILVASLCISCWSFIRTRALSRQNYSETLYAKFLGHVFEFTASLAAVLLFYHALLLLILTGWE